MAKAGRAGISAVRRALLTALLVSLVRALARESEPQPIDPMATGLQDHSDPEDADDSEEEGSISISVQVLSPRVRHLDS